MQTFDMRSAAIAGVIAGITFMALEMILVATIGGGSPWGPPRMIGAMLLGEGVLPPPGTFDLLVVTVAMIIHFLLAVILGLIFAWIADKAGWGGVAILVAGTVFGLLVYVVNFYGMTAIWPWFAMARGGISIFAHAVFGFVLGYAYRTLRPLS